LGSALNATIAILLALQERNRSGRGQFVEATLYDTAITLLYPYSANWLLSHQPPKRTGNAHPNVSPYDQFRTKTKRIFLGVGNDRQFSRLCEEIGRPDLRDNPLFRRNADRLTNRAALRRELEAALADLDGEAVALRLLEKGIPCGPVLEVPDVLQHPHTQHRQMVTSLGDYSGIGNPVKLSRTPATVRRPPPDFGSANHEILAEAGYSPGEIDALIASGVVSQSRR